MNIEQIYFHMKLPDNSDLLCLPPRNKYQQNFETIILILNVKHIVLEFALINSLGKIKFLE